jgi:hypothetical protein
VAAHYAPPRIPQPASRRRHWFSLPELAIVIGVPLLAACASDEPAAPVGNTLATRVVSGANESIRDRLAAIADRHPGFGGIYVDSSGAIVVRNARGRRLSVDSVVSEVSAITRLPQNRRIRVETAEHNFRQLTNGLRALRGELMQLPRDAQYSLVVDQRTSTILVGSTPQKVSGVRAIATRLGITQMVRVDSLSGPIIMPIWNALQEGEGGGGSGSGTSCANNLRCTFVSSIRGGVEIGRTVFNPNTFQQVPSECSLGFNVILDAAPSSIAAMPPSGERYFITASHCTQQYGMNSGIPDVLRQNGELSSPQFGTEVNDPAWFPTAGGRIGRYSDAALLRYDVSRESAFNFGRVYVTPSAFSTSLGSTNNATNLSSAFGFSGSLAAGYFGAPVAKTGRTTGTTQGTVTGLCVDLIGISDADPQRGQLIDLFCQIQMTIDMNGGDSGGPVWYTREAGYGAPTAAGIVAACGVISFTNRNCDRTKSYASDIYYVVQELKQMPNGVIRNVFVQP